VLIKPLCTIALLALPLFGSAQDNNNISLSSQSQSAALVSDELVSQLDVTNEFTQQELLTSEAQHRIKQFAGQLKSALVTAIKEQGLAHAVNVCHERAPQIAQELSTDGWRVARTSLKTRNDVNKPDQWELETLKDFDRRFKGGTAASQLTASLTGPEQYRYMKAIPTDQVCLACHGSSVDADLSASINRMYPNDIAIGFTLEDIRGAFTLSKQINE